MSTIKIKSFKLNHNTDFCLHKYICRKGIGWHLKRQEMLLRFAQSSEFYRLTFFDLRYSYLTYSHTSVQIQSRYTYIKTVGHGAYGVVMFVTLTIHLLIYIVYVMHTYMYVFLSLTISSFQIRYRLGILEASRHQKNW